MKIEGKLKAKMDTQRVSDRFQKREFIITIESEDGHDTQHVSFQLQQDKCSIINDILIGTDVSVEFELRGREWEAPQGVKYFNTLLAWTVIPVNTK